MVQRHSLMDAYCPGPSENPPLEPESTVLVVHADVDSGNAVGGGVATASGEALNEDCGASEGDNCSGEVVNEDCGAGEGGDRGPAYRIVQPEPSVSESEVNLMNAAPLVAVY